MRIYNTFGVIDKHGASERVDQKPFANYVAVGISHITMSGIVNISPRETQGFHKVLLKRTYLQFIMITIRLL